MNKKRTPRYKSSTEYTIPNDGRVYAPRDGAYRKKLLDLMNRLQKPFSETLRYLIDVEELSIASEDLENQSVAFANALDGFLNKLQEINPRANTLFREELVKRGVLSK